MKQLTIDRAARDNQIRRLPVPDRLKDLYMAVDRWLLLLLEKGAALQDDGGTLIGDISQAVLAELMQTSPATVRRVLLRNREVDPPWLTTTAQRDPMTGADTATQYELHWPRILQFCRGGHTVLKGGSSADEGGVTPKTSEKQGSTLDAAQSLSDDSFEFEVEEQSLTHSFIEAESRARDPRLPELPADAWDQQLAGPKLYSLLRDWWAAGDVAARGWPADEVLGAILAARANAKRAHRRYAEQCLAGGVSDHWIQQARTLRGQAKRLEHYSPYAPPQENR